MAVSWKGRRNCSCMVKYTKLVEERLGYSLTVYQGGYNGGAVAASAGTHDGGGVGDFGNFTEHELKVMRQSGGIAWKRTPKQGFSLHNHTPLRGCPHQSAGCAWQVSAKMNRNENGLANRGRDDGPQVKIPTWEQAVKAYEDAKKKAAAEAKKKAAAEAKKKAAQKKLDAKLRAHKLPQRLANGKVVMLEGIVAVRLSYLLASRKSKTYSRHVYVVQGWLKRVKCYDGARDGVWGPKTQAAYDKFRRQVKWGGRKTGAPGLGSLQLLGKIVKTLYPIKEK